MEREDDQVTISDTGKKVSQDETKEMERNSNEKRRVADFFKRLEKTRNNRIGDDEK